MVSAALQLAQLNSPRLLAHCFRASMFFPVAYSKLPSLVRTKSHSTMPATFPRAREIAAGGDVFEIERLECVHSLKPSVFLRRTPES